MRRHLSLFHFSLAFILKLYSIFFFFVFDIITLDVCLTDLQRHFYKQSAITFVYYFVIPCVLSLISKKREKNFQFYYVYAYISNAASQFSCSYIIPPKSRIRKKKIFV